jgi:pentatricopeptide repeat protein
MLNHNITPSSVTYNSLIDGQIRIKNLKSAWDLYDEMKCRGLKCDNFTYSSLVKGINSKDDT